MSNSHQKDEHLATENDELDSIDEKPIGENDPANDLIPQKETYHAILEEFCYKV